MKEMYMIGGMNTGYPHMVVIDKKLGETPLEALGRVRAAYGIAAEIPMTYAGRLDPMATGVLIILIGDECKKKDDYNGYDKEYECEMLVGVSSDTGDVLGLVTADDMSKGGLQLVMGHDDMYWQELIGRLVGSHRIPYPAYSSQPVQGKPLFVWAREGKLADIEIPKREMVVSKAVYMGKRSVKSEEVVNVAVKNVEIVQGDFRQKEIVERWNGLKGVDMGDNEMCIVKFRIVCESGTYVRALVEELGKWLGAPTLTYGIRRTRVGAHPITSCTNL